MIDERLLFARALKKWVRNPAAAPPGLFTSIFYLVLFGNSFNPSTSSRPDSPGLSQRR